MNDIEPLFILAQKNELGTLQKMDAETLSWIKDNSCYYVSNLNIKKKKIPSISEDEYKLLKAFIPHKEWYLLPQHYYSIHGISHTVRVMIISLILCKILGVKIVSPYIIASSLHDIRRENDNEDPFHGFRASDWFINNLNYYKKSHEMDDKTNILSVQKSIYYHQIRYEEIPNDIFEKISMSIDVLKASDALDRFRLPKEKWWPQISQIKLKSAHTLIPKARELTIRSEEQILKGKDPVKSILDISRELFN